MHSISDVLIEFKNVRKTYTMDRRPSLKNRIKHLFINRTDDHINAVSSISFTMKSGTVVGLSGPNGSGKTTILRLIASITKPTSGSIITNGSVVPIIELSIGFHDDLSGAENILISGTLLGMSLSQIQQQFDSIVKFAGVKKFIRVPLKKYSTGMRARLGISVALHRQPDILLLDEALTVSDDRFKSTLYPKIAELLHHGAIIVIVSHDIRLLRSMCHHIIKLNRGKITGEEFPHAASLIWNTI